MIKLKYIMEFCTAIILAFIIVAILSEEAMRIEMSAEKRTYH